MTPIRHLLEALFNPFFLIIILFAFSFIALYRHGNQKRVRLFFTVTFLSILLFSTGWLPKWVTERLENQYPVVEKPNPAIEWVVVLGGGMAQVDAPVNDVLYCASIKRLLEGLRLYKLLPRAKIVLSGGGYRNIVSEAEGLFDLFLWFNVDKKNVILETRSVNTAAQAQEIKIIIGTRPFYLVTSAIHMPRSMALCKQQGLNPIAAPTDFTYFWDDERWQKFYIPNPNNMLYLNIAWHEILGTIWGRVRGQL